jgi:hypothetical protein
MRWIGRLPTKYSPERKFESEIDSAKCCSPGKRVSHLFVSASISACMRSVHSSDH